MSEIFPYRGQQKGFRGFKIEKDSVHIEDFRVSNRHQLPAILSNEQPPGHLPGVGGGIAYDLVTKRPYYSDGYTWLPVGANVLTGTVGSYSFLKDGVQPVPINTEVTISPWEIISADVYHSLPGWNLTTGIYTASVEEVLTLEVNISWSAGVSNLGNRILKIQRMKSGSGIWDTIKESVTQADPDLSVKTTQECQIHAKIFTGDSIRIMVAHGAPVPIFIAKGLCTSVSGFRVNVI